MDFPLFHWQKLPDGHKLNDSPYSAQTLNYIETGHLVNSIWLRLDQVAPAGTGRAKAMTKEGRVYIHAKPGAEKLFGSAQLCISSGDWPVH